MRTTIQFDDDTAKAVEKLRREQGLGVSEAVNELIRRGLLPRPRTKRFRQQTFPLGLKIDITSVADAIEEAEGPNHK